ncbi:MAG: hypothetical protein PHI19_06155 [Clostridia bacterium]|nr:hypothetical protein [Clostridia bacterium]
MGYKSRGNYPVTVCIKRCANRSDENCKKCLGSGLFKAIEEEPTSEDTGEGAK